MMPAMLMFALFDANRIFLTSFEMTTASTILITISLPMHAIICYSLVHVAGFGLYGLPIAAFINYFNLFVGLTIYSTY